MEIGTNARGNEKEFQDMRSVYSKIHRHECMFCVPVGENLGQEYLIGMKDVACISDELDVCCYSREKHAVRSHTVNNASQ